MQPDLDIMMEAMRFRHACKRFDTDRAINDERFTQILELGRLSPSSFGMEPWRFTVFTDTKSKARLKPLCWDQEQITSCSHLLLIMAQTGALAPGSEYPRTMFSRRALPTEKTEAYFRIYDGFATEILCSEGLFAWSARQCYITAANMMTGAATVGIDSCPIEGFERNKVEALLNVDSAVERIALMIAFGYRINPQPEKLRLSLDSLVTYNPPLS